MCGTVTWFANVLRLHTCSMKCGDAGDLKLLLFVVAKGHSIRYVTEQQFEPPSNSHSWLWPCSYGRVGLGGSVFVIFLCSSAVL